MNYVDGVYCPPINEQYFDNINPATGAVYCLIPDSDENDLALAVTAAEKAFPIWSNIPAEERSKSFL